MSALLAGAMHRNPFPGLRPFREGEEHLFFGRESKVDAMIDKLAATRFLAVVGSSGSGKSSLVNCGLRPALHGGLMASAGTAWRVAQFRPGNNPLRRMARALAEDGVLFRDYQAQGLTLVEVIETSLRVDNLALADVYEQARLNDKVNLLVVVDQFEELFRYRELQKDHDERVSGRWEEAVNFVSLLLAAVNQTTHPIYVVLTMRSDFLGECVLFSGLPEAINEGQYLVPRMTRDERRAAIAGPVGVGGASIAPVLLTRLVNDVGDDPDQLSILQHALNRTWAYWEDECGAEGPLDLPHYEAIGGMASALDQHAEDAYSELHSTRQKEICEKLFKALTDKATDPHGVRRPTTLRVLCDLTEATETEVLDVMGVFRDPSRSFLMPPAGEPCESDTVIDISHESLMRVWRRLVAWTDEEARSVQMLNRLADAAELYEAGKASLWRDPEVQQAVDWRDQNNPNKSWALHYHREFQGAMRFLEASVALRDAEKRGFDPWLVQRLQSLGYAIEEEVSQSDFGIVYRAKHLADDRTVALKTVPANKHVTDRESLLREAEITGRLDHEGIVSVLEVHSEASTPFFIMEWVDGRPINQALEGADWHTKVRVVEAVCDPIEYAHQQGVVHGDLKPNNILIRPDGRPKILDFGMSRLLNKEANPSQRSSVGAVGTVLYMAPEQVRGEELGPRTDVYALGIILYELLTGTPPFTADNLHDVRTAQLHQAPDLPMLREETVPEQLQRICLKALEKKEADRYGSVHEMREDLKRYRQGTPVLVRPSYYNNLIQSPAKDHVEQIEEWYKKCLITESEYVRLRRAYETLTRSGLKAVSESRLVHPSVLTLYLGSWLFLAGAAMWLILHYLKPGSGLGIVEGSSFFRVAFRVALGMLPVLLTNWLWLFFTGRGSYRFAFAAMVVGLVSLPFAVGVAVYELAHLFGGLGPLRELVAFGDREQRLPSTVPIPEIALALLLSLAWDTYVAIKSRTLTSATIAGIHFVLLYIAVLDVKGLQYLFGDGFGYGGLCMLFAAGILGFAGVIVAKRPEPTGQSKPLFAIAIVVAILATQGIALQGPNTWGWKPHELGTALFEILLGAVYLVSSIYLRNRFRVEGATAHLLLARLAPVAILAGIIILDQGWPKNQPQFLVANLTPWAPVFLIASVVVVFLAAKLQSSFYFIIGLGSLAYAVANIAYEIQVRSWLWPAVVIVAGLAITGGVTWWDVRGRAGQDIDDVGEELIKQSRRKLSTTAHESDLGTVVHR
jgi:serine/threonine protein kinase